MTDDLTRLRWNRKPTPEQPLMGLTILAVEDSRFASEALRLACMRSGARLRRADCLASARRHLAVYRPTVVMVDLGLPDGCGTELIEELCAADVDPPIILAMSGDEGAETEAIDAGANGFLAKPLPGLAGFQAMILSLLPASQRLAGPRGVDTSSVTPDDMALHDDFKRAVDALDVGPGGRAAVYAAQFVSSVARCAEDNSLDEAAQRFARSQAAGQDVDLARGHLRNMLAERISERRPI